MELEAPQMMSSSLGAMGSLLGKLHTQLYSPEHELPGSLKDGILHLKQDLEELNSLMVDLSGLGRPNAMVKRWMNEVRELSYDMEDFIDSVISSSMMASRETNKEILSMVKKFRNLVKQARERHERYELSRWSSNPYPSPSCMNSRVNGKAAELFGIKESKGELVKWLKPIFSNVDEPVGRLRVASILGPAGVGKSTLAQELYREIGLQFERRAFVRASRVPDARRLLRSMISQVRRHQRPPCGLPVQELVDNLRTHLQQKRYFIVIDGLWETTSWDIIRTAFPEGAHCSRVLITTDIEEVALECCDYLSNSSVTSLPDSMLDSDSNFHAQEGIFKMEPLGTDDSMELFFNRVFASKPEFSEQLKKYSEEIIRKCSGLPLATVIIASVFAGQTDNSELWRHIKEYLSSRNILSSEDLLREVIVLSYYSLSQHLKTCLLYFSLYPEGCTFLKSDVVKQWTAEGFISAVAGKSTNEIAECYFDELVSRGLVQTNHINLVDEVMFYTVHSTVFEVIRQKSVEENFTTVIDYSETIPKLSAKVRRLSLGFSNAKYATKPEGFTLSPVRSLTFYGLVECLPSIMEFKLLRVLILEFWGDREMFDLSGICIMLQLRYFRITADFIIKLPVKMRGLKYLETLEIYASVLTVPSDVVHLPKLLHLHLQGDIKLPDYVGQLRSLRTLQSFDLSSNSEDNVRSLGEMMNLHDLHMTCSTGVLDHLERNLVALASLIGKHGNLKSLTLAPGVSCTSIYKDCLSIVSSPPIFLEKFELLPPICIFSRLPEWIGRLQKLCILKIVVKELRRDDIYRIAKLQELTVLSLYVRQPTAQSIVFNSAAFPVLKYLKFRCGVLRLAFQAEAIPNLRRLKLEFNAHRGGQYSDMLAGIEHLLNLQEIAVRVGAAPSTEESDKMAAESVLEDAISKHSRHLSFSVRRADFFEEEIPEFSDMAPSSLHLDEVLNRFTMVDVTSQPSEINEVEEVSRGNEYRGPNNPVKQKDRMYMYQHTEGPKFGDCEDEGVDLHTQYFKNAFKGKSASPNYQKGDPETLSMDPPSAKASPLRTGLDPLVQKSEYEGHANRGEPRGSSEVWSKPERGQALPRFGWWDSNPTDDDGFTAIFNKVRDDKKSGDAPVITSDGGYDRSNQGRKYKPAEAPVPAQKNRLLGCGAEVGEGVKTMLARLIQLADEVAEQCAAARSFRAECAELKVLADKLAALLRQTARAPDLYDRPAARIMVEAAMALSRASALSARCARGHPRLRSLFTLRPAAEFPRAVAALDRAIEDVTWLLRISSRGAARDSDDDSLLGLPNIAQTEPILFFIWDNVACLHTGSPATRADCAANLASLARDSQHFAKLIIEEEGVPPLLKLLKDGTDEGHEAAARALGLLGCDAESVNKLVQAGVCSSFAAALKDPPMRVQAAVAESIANLADKSSTCQDLFAQNNAVRYLVGHLASGTIQEHSRYSVGSHSSKNSTAALQQQHMKDPEVEDPEIKAHLKAMAAKALWKLAHNHLVVCKSITESRALLCFAVLLEKGDGDMGTEVQFFSAMAIMEIARVAEHNLVMIQSAFKPSSPAAKAVVDQLLRVVRKGEYDVLLLPCITALGCLARTFTESETRVIAPLVQLLDEREPPVTKEAVVALTKFACSENHLHVNHCKAIVDDGGARHLVQLVYFSDEIQIEALILLCYIALYVPESEELAQAGVLAVLLWASKQAHMVQDTRVEALLPEAKARLEPFQSRASR